MIVNSDCLAYMKSMESHSIDFIITDPPYGLKFMSKKWDYDLPSIDIWKEALRVVKPGGMLAAFGGSRTHHRLMCSIEDAGWEIRDVMMWIYGSGFPKSHNFGKQLGGDWQGYGTALKPAYEPIILCMAPLDGTFAQNAEKWGVGGINIAKGRIPHNGNISGAKIGRWPPNCLFDEESAAMLDEQSGINASRFFYCSKASTSERNAGLEGMELKQSVYSKNAKNGEGLRVSDSKIPHQNHHPTIKPLSLMRYLINLLAPPGDPLLLDPFAGSGSTLVAAKQIDIRAIGIEMNAEYCEIADKRISAAELEDVDKLYHMLI